MRRSNGGQTPEPHSQPHPGDCVLRQAHPRNPSSPPDPLRRLALNLQATVQRSPTQTCLTDSRRLRTESAAYIGRPSWPRHGVQRRRYLGPTNAMSVITLNTIQQNVVQTDSYKYEAALHRIPHSSSPGSYFTDNNATMHAPLASTILAVLVSTALALNQPPAPAGRPYTEVHEVPAGGTIAHVGRDIHLLAANGTILHVSANVKPATTPATPPERTGWITYANWLNTSPSPISVFNTSWTVPAAPSNYDGQTIFLFNAIEPGAGDAIIQPVLQYGPSAAGGDAYWAVATWYLYGPDVFHTPLLPVDVGQTLRGMISLLGQSGGTYDYNSQFTNIEGTSLSVTGAEQLAWATVTLEAYDITSSSDYPPGASSFYEISFAFSGLAPQVHWEVVNDEDDGLSTVVNSDGSLFGVVTITY